MKLMTFPEINDLENGQAIPAFEGTLKKVYGQKSDVGQYGQWWLQNLILQDEHANELQVTWACPDPWEPKDEGKHLVFESGRDKKEQLVGIKREIRNKNGKRYESVKVDDRARVRTNNATGSRSSKAVEQPARGDVGSTPEAVNSPDPDWPEAEQRDKPKLTDNGITEARKHIMQSANLYVLCVSVVESYIAAHLPEIARTSEQFQSTVASLFIEASHSGFVQKMPVTPIKENEQRKA